MRWKVQVSGEHQVLEELTHTLNSDWLSITTDEDSFVLTSESLDNLLDDMEVREKAFEMLTQVNGELRFLLGRQSFLSLGNITQIHESGKEQVFVYAFEEVSISDMVTVFATDDVGNTSEFHQTDPISTWIPLVSRYDDVAHVFRLLATQGDDWVNLYRIYEIIRDDVGGESTIERNGWAPKNSLKLFRHSGDNPHSAGDLARHGTRKYKPPKNPMSLSHAQALISGVMQNWLRWKSGQPRV